MLRKKATFIPVTEGEEDTSYFVERGLNTTEVSDARVMHICHLFIHATLPECMVHCLGAWFVAWVPLANNIRRLFTAY